MGRFIKFSGFYFVLSPGPAQDMHFLSSQREKVDPRLVQLFTSLGENELLRGQFGFYLFLCFGSSESINPTASVDSVTVRILAPIFHPFASQGFI